VKLFFFRREPATLRERLLEAIEQGLKAEKVLFVSLGEGFYVHVMPPVYDFLQERERFEREAAEARQAVLGDMPLGRYTLINFREIREGRLTYSDDYQEWADKRAVKLTGELGLIFLVREPEVRQIIEQECQRQGLACEPQGEWNMRVSDTKHIIYTGDLVYEAIGRATNLSELVRGYLSSWK
jgi:hypothetical protein